MIWQSDSCAFDLLFLILSSQIFAGCQRPTNRLAWSLSSMPIPAVLFERFVAELWAFAERIARLSWGDLIDRSLERFSEPVEADDIQAISLLYTSTMIGLILFALAFINASIFWGYTTLTYVKILPLLREKSFQIIQSAYWWLLKRSEDYPWQEFWLSLPCALSTILM